MKPRPLIFQVSLFASSVLLAQDIEPLSEDFLLFLADGMEVDGEWKDPMSLASLSELDEMPNDEIAWLAQQEIAEQQMAEQDIAEPLIENSERGSISGDENE